MFVSRVTHGGHSGGQVLIKGKLHPMPRAGVGPGTLVVTESNLAERFPEKYEFESELKTTPEEATEEEQQEVQESSLGDDSAYPPGDPREDWTRAQLEAYAKDYDFDLSGCATKRECVELMSEELDD